MVTENSACARTIEAATEHLCRILDSSGQTVLRQGFVARLCLSSLDVVAERFGAQGADSLCGAVFTCLTGKLQEQDLLYHWSGNCFLIITERPVYESQFIAEISRILARNRDFPIQVGERRIMLRVPIVLSVYPLAKLKGAEDLSQPVQSSEAGSKPAMPLSNSDQLPGHAIFAGSVPESTPREFTE